MNEPAIRYVSTMDGLRIAYCETGHGLPLVLMPQPVSHLRLLWHTMPHRELQARLAERFRLVQYDGRGTGMSERGLSDDYDARDYEVDLEAVVDALGLERFVLWGANGTNHAAVRYAVAHPERVLSLVLWQTLSDLRDTEAGLLARFQQSNWERAVVMMAQAFLPGVDIETATSVVKSSLNQEDAVRLASAATRSSIRDALPALTMPVLLLYKTPSFLRTLEFAQEAARLTPNSRLVFLTEDADLYGYPRDPSQLIEQIDVFLASLMLGPFAAPSTAVVVKAGGSNGMGTLTRREVEVLRLIANGGTNREIAGALVLSERTVARHITNLYAKIGARSKAEATAIALRARIF